MKCDKLFETVDGLYESYLGVWEDICNLESPHYDKAGVDSVGAYFIKIAQEKGWKIEIFEMENAGNAVCITMNPDAEAAPITFSAHMDTVHPVGSFGSPAVHFDDDKIYGPGVTDCKGGLVSALCAMDALDRIGFVDRPVQFILQSNEEGGSREDKQKTVDYMCEKARGSIAFINLEGGARGAACVQRKGILTYRIKVTGVEAHSSLCATEGASAIAEAARMILELEKYKDAEGLTCNCGMIQGGTAHNTVPGYCEFRANIRFVDEKQFDEISAVVEKLAANPHNPKCRIEAEIHGLRPAMERVERNLKLLDTINGIFAENGLETLEPVKKTGGSDAAHITKAGIPCLDNLGTWGGRIHSPDEYGLVESLKNSAKQLAAIAYCI